MLGEEGDESWLYGRILGQSDLVKLDNSCDVSRGSVLDGTV